MAEMLRPNVVEIKPESLPPSMQSGSPPQSTSPSPSPQANSKMSSSTTTSTTTTTSTGASPPSPLSNIQFTNNRNLISSSTSEIDHDLLNNTIITPPTPITTTNPSATSLMDSAINQLVQEQQDLTIIPKLIPILPSRTQCVYTECYCEENIWKLCDKIRTDYSTEIDYCQVAFISNSKRMVPLWRQKAGKNEEKLALWDYHVILFYNPDDRCLVYDMDSDLPFPTHFHRYVNETFRTENILQPEYHRFFRVIDAAKFLTLFSSDRSHMKKEDGTWLKPPPSYPAIYKNGVNNLQQFLDMTLGKNEFGEVLNLTDLVRRYFKPKQLS